ncbi:MAG TPA: hypothetical protein VNB94_06975, partial [Mycobacteriales bacterium]|nr:hypothetical protein [Mycobacteriales bacterium]
MSQLRHLVAVAAGTLAIGCSGGGVASQLPVPGSGQAVSAPAPAPAAAASSPAEAATSTPSAADLPPIDSTPPAPASPAAARTAASVQATQASSSCPTAYAAPDQRRPIVTLAFRRSDDASRVVGQEKVRFTPDRQVDELVFRLWPNAPRTSDAGVRMNVRRVLANGASRFTIESAGAPAGRPGTLLRLRLPAPVPAGQPIDAVVDFEVVLGAGSDDRVGRSGGTTWWGSAFPLLAWERGRGWAREPATRAFAEATSSEAFDLRNLTVDTAAGDVVLTSGRPGRVDALPGNRRRHHFSAPAVRDVMVAAGQFKVSRRTEGGVPIAIGVAPGLRDDPVTMARLHAEALRSHVARFGRY